MRHRKSFNHLGRTSSHRNAMLSNMAASLILHKRIETTTAKAKALRSYIEPLITKSKDDTTHSRRVVFSYLRNKEAVAELFREVAVKVHDRPGGYTRVLKLGARLGDSAEMCIIELVDFNENLLGEATTKVKTGRRRRGSKKKDHEKPAPAVAAPVSKDEKLTDDAEPLAADNKIADETTVTENEDNAGVTQEEAAVADAEEISDKGVKTGADTVDPANEEVASAEDKAENSGEAEVDEPEEDKSDLK